MVMLPNKDEVRGKIDKTMGTVKERIGRENADPDLEDEGAAQRTAGGIEQGVGKAKRKVGEALKDLGKKINR